jgi:hypothetical protein
MRHSLANPIILERGRLVRELLEFKLQLVPMGQAARASMRNISYCPAR